MNYKPLSIIILGVLHILTPFNMILFYSAFFNMGPMHFLKLAIYENTFTTNTLFFFLYPLSGVFILLVKRWSLMAYLLIQCVGMAFNWQFLSAAFASKNYALLSYYIIFSLINMSIVSYFLLSAIKKAYTNPKLRWWEQSPRYYINMSSNFTVYQFNAQKPQDILNLTQCGEGGQEIIFKNSIICDISRTGVHLYSGQEIPLGTLGSLEIIFYDHKIQVYARAVWSKISDGGKRTYGMEFLNLGLMQRWKLHRLIDLLEQMDVIRRPPKREYLTEIKEWFVHEDSTRSDKNLQFMKSEQDHNKKKVG